MPSEPHQSPPSQSNLRLPEDLQDLLLSIPPNGMDLARLATKLQLNEKTVLERLKELNRFAIRVDHSVWLRQREKKWSLTAEGATRQSSIRESGATLSGSATWKKNKSVSAKEVLRIAGGVAATNGFLGKSSQEFLRQHPEAALKLSTVRGYERIRGLANGRFDLIVVTDEPDLIRAIANIELEIEVLFLDRLHLVANTRGRESWKAYFRTLAAHGTATASQISELPLVLPEQNASRRRQFELCFARQMGTAPDPVLEIGGWDNILAFAAAGVGAGLVTNQVLVSRSRQGRRRPGLTPFDEVKLSEQYFPPLPVQLVTRKVVGQKSKADQVRMKLLKSFANILRENTKIERSLN